MDRTKLVVGGLAGALVAIGAGVGVAWGRMIDSRKPKELPVGSSVMPQRNRPKRLIVIATGSGCGDGISFETAIDTVAAMNSLEPGPLAIAIHTLGGDASAVNYLARAIRASPHEVTAHVPYVALSGGTIVALAAQEIVMDPSAVLGPVDPQFFAGPGNVLRELVEKKPIEHLNEEYYVFGRYSEKAIAETHTLLEELRVPPAARARLIDGDTTHGHPITLSEAASLGLPVRAGIPPSIREQVNAILAERRSRRGTFVIFG